MGTLSLLKLGLILAAAAGVSAFLGYGVIFLFNRIPARWLCDYGETPDDRHLPPRVAKQPWAVLLSLTFTAAFAKIFLSPRLYDGLTHGAWGYALATLPALCLLALIGLSDRKYRIIPDQFLVLLAVTGIGFAATGEGLLPHLFGLLFGGGLFLAVAVIGGLVTKKEVLGFGDVKLMAVCGLIAGLRGAILILLMTGVSSAAVFALRVARGDLKLSDEAALGPFIALAAAIYILFADELSALPL